MLFNKKRSVSIILSKMHPDGHSDEVEIKPESGEQDEYVVFAEHLISAIKNGSVQDVASCLREFHEMIAEEDEEQDEEAMEG